MILWNSFSPALTDGDKDSSATGGNWTPVVWRQYVKEFGNVVNVSVGERDDNYLTYTTVLSQPENIKAIVLIWRWPMPSYPRRHQAWIRQMELASFARKNKIPVLIHDQDLKYDAMRVASEIASTGTRVTLTAPADNPPQGYYRLYFPRFGLPRRPREIREYDYMYVGNNYERFDQVKEYAGSDTMRDMRVAFYGNWMTYNPEREHPDEVVKQLKYVEFKGKLPQDEVEDKLADSWFTWHFARPDYCDIGMITLRWLEAANAGTVAIVPYEFNMPTEYEPYFKLSDKRQEDLLVDFDEYSAVLKKQREFVKQTFNTNAWVSAMRKIIR